MNEVYEQSKHKDTHCIPFNIMVPRLTIFPSRFTLTGLSGSYWLGASDQGYEGDWLWVSDNSRVDRGTPFWAIHNGIFGKFTNR